MATKTRKPCPEFDRARQYISRYSTLKDAELDLLTVWTMGTWTFSPAAPASPFGYPYLYIVGPKGSGKTVVGQDVLGSICRMPEPTVGATGAALFRMIGEIDTDTNEVVPFFPTLIMDEVDATWSGAKDEALRMIVNAGYKRGASVPRANGKTSIRFPVYCPKILMGIDNGHLPDTVADRSIRIEVERAIIGEFEPWYNFATADESAEISESLAAWAKDNAMCLRDFNHKPIDGIPPRHWENALPLVQLARAIGIEDRMRDVLEDLLTRNPVQDTRVQFYQVIANAFAAAEVNRLRTEDIVDALKAAGIPMASYSGKALGAMFGNEVGTAGVINFTSTDDPDDDRPKRARGLYLHQFDTAFAKYLPTPAAE